jgi:phosphoribosylformylglycinamidine cyclo-ligase
MSLTYKDAGVDIDAGNALVERIKPAAASTRRPEVLGSLGGFAGLFRLPEGYRDPVLVSGTDGVGTKLLLAFDSGNHRTVGIDLVAMAVNDILVTGAEPLFFLDYLATSRVDVAVAGDVIEGIADGCRQAGCALLGGETAELPGFYQPGHYDLAGFCVGVVERDQIRDGTDLVAGDVVLGIPSAGIHSNGLTLARKAVFDELGLSLESTPDALGGITVGDELLRPTAIYANAFAALRDAGVRFKTAAHITGGGLIENPPRMFPTDDLAIAFDTTAWDVPAIFELIASAGVDATEMRRTFNMGIGMIAVVAAGDADAAVSALSDAGARAIGTVRSRTHDAVEFV